MIKSDWGRWLEENLVCPRDFQSLTVSDEALTCPNSHVYPILDGIPILLLEEFEPTQSEFTKTLEAARSSQNANPETERPVISSTLVDPFVQEVIAATGGSLYKELVGQLTRYPIPELPLPQTSLGEYFLDLGCNWGRWCMSAARKGYVPVGIDHNVKAINAARRAAKQLGLTAYYLVADARHLPFAAHRFDVVFSFSVLQHFKKEDVRQTLLEISRVLNPRGFSFIQMANLLGLHNLYHLWRLKRRGFRSFDVHYWSPRELINTFRRYVGPSSLQADGYFTLNPQFADMDLLSPRMRGVVYLSEFLRRMSRMVPGMQYLADSLYVKSTKGRN